jgi:signal transduction histidine kinase
MLLKQADDPARVRRLGQAALAAGQRGELLTRRLSAFSQGADAPAFEPIEAGALLRGLEGRLRGETGGRMDLLVEGPAEPTPLRLDPVAFEGAVRALVRNAVEASGEGASVALRLERLDTGGARLSVRDAGPGMDPDIAARAAEPFFSTRPGQAGLGLSQVYAFARQCGGTLQIDSRPGEGTEAAVLLPA